MTDATSVTLAAFALLTMAGVLLCGALSLTGAMVALERWLGGER